ncbi:MAG: nitrogen regulation protein NR(II) [Gammaproteobacteria bacterium]|nr:nitrogen regulation protein NR(II) [Gammaproteobacteria bacterium]
MPVHQDVLDAIKVAIVVVDTEFAIRYMNNTAEDFCGGSLEHFRDQKIGSLFEGQEVTEEALQQCFDAYETYTLRQVQLKVIATNQHTVANIAVSPIRGQRLVFEIEPFDRVMFMNKEDQMRNAQLASRQLVRGMAHEIKNPLGSIRGAAQLLRKDLETSEQTDYTDLIIGEVDRLKTLVDRMLGPNHTPCFEAVNIHEVIEKVLRIVSSEMKSNWELERDYDPSMPGVFGDFDHLTQALLNIIQNANDATQDETSPRLVIRTGIEHQFTIGTTRHPMVARIQIEDNGIGIPQEIQDQIFFPLVTGKASGTGLGLAITHTIIGMHSGLIMCTSERGLTTFVIYLPLAVEGKGGPRTL